MLVWGREVLKVSDLMEYLNIMPLSSQNICTFVVLMWKYEYRDLADWFGESKYRYQYKSFMQYISQTILQFESSHASEAVDNSKS